MFGLEAKLRSSAPTCNRRRRLGVAKEIELKDIKYFAINK